MHHLLNEVRTDRSIGMDFNLFEAWPLGDMLRNHVRVVIKLMTGL